MYFRRKSDNLCRGLIIPRFLVFLTVELEDRIMPGEPPVTGNKSSGKVKRISIPRVQSSTDTELQSQQSGSTPLQSTALHCVTFRSDIEDSSIPPNLRIKLLDLFQQIEKEFEMLCAENAGCKLIYCIL